MLLYPMLFDTQAFELIWGGDKLNKLLGKDLDPSKKIGETWELSDVPGKETVIKNGEYKGRMLHELIALDAEAVLGKGVKPAPGNRFPLLVKLIDAADRLSVQVHPDDEVAAERHGSAGKNEMWYVMQHEPGASLVSGFSSLLSREEFVQKAQDGSIEDVLHQVPVSVGDTFYIPAGKVHAIGKGIMLAEIQQSSDITYRIYDYKRVDAQGCERELHLQEAADVVDLGDLHGEAIRVKGLKNDLSPLVNSPFFTTDLLALDGDFSIEVSSRNSFVLLFVVEGELVLNAVSTTLALKVGELVLLPASISSCQLEGKAKLLVSYVA